ncbi:eukaryotic translation initiation factor 3 [Echinococcus multilocularis]|uniref:Eukaryotic translation initiation factor 3 n=1 Tax=Echinococcus multilocularis TaxID=6211 RepID=A0A087VZ29_ECHMU|nr:eukaryotic translation initiation factor 3 [Echinococcus multilocularis]
MDTQQVSCVKVSGLVLLKIIKHCEEETLLATEHVNGVLLGLAVGNALEITNCFPLPKISEDDQTGSEALSAYEFDMMKNMREINSDYLSVGYYLGGYGCSFLTRSLLETLFQYQTLISEAVLLTYDPSCATRGQQGLKSYRLSKVIFDAMLETEKRVRLMGNAKNSEISWECDASLHCGKTNFTQLLEELPTSVVNSKLARILLKDIVDQSDEQIADTTQVKSRNSFSGLHLSMASDLEQQLRSLIQRLDNIYELQYTYQRTLSKPGTSTAPKDQRIKELAPIRLETALASCQADLYSSGIAQLAGQTVGKLMLAEAIHQYRNVAPNVTDTE